MKANSVILKGASTLALDANPVLFDGIYPYEYASPKDELVAARTTAWLGVYLMNTKHINVTGPDAAKAITSCCVNRDFSRLKVGGSSHALICNNKGQIVDNGIVIRMGKNHFRTYALYNLMYHIPKLGLDAEFQICDEYFFQIDGPKSLEIMEEASQCDLHDLKFAQNKIIQIAGTDVFIHRLGMSGALAYEVHGELENMEIVYQTIREAGKKFGIQPLGIRNYSSNHTSGGYPNQFIHFAYASIGRDMPKPMAEMKLSGSAADDIENYFATPYDVGWGYTVDFDHDYPGKEALEKIAETNNSRVPVTLEWNLEDVSKVVENEISGEGAISDEGIFDYDQHSPEFKRLHADYVMVDEKNIGIASGRIKDFYHKTFISLAFIDKGYAEEGRELYVIWGKHNEPQKRIRAKVARFPYYSGEFRNETCDVMKMVPQRPFAK